MFDVTLSLAAPPSPAAASCEASPTEQHQQQEGSPAASSTGSPSLLVKSSTVVLRRDYQEFRALHVALTSLLSSSNSSKAEEDGGALLQQQLPPLPQYAGAETTDAEMAEHMAKYLRQLLELPEVCASGPFMRLLNDHDGAGGAESSGQAPENAVDFLLQPCPATSTYVARRAQHQEEVEMPQGSTVLWRFSVGDGLDVQFSAVFTPSGEQQQQQQQQGGQRVLMEGRFPAAVGTTASSQEDGVVQGSFTASVAGSCVFKWDNSYSRLRGKQVQHLVQVVSPEAMQAAVEAAAELARASSRNRSLITARIREGKGAGGLIRVDVTPVAHPAAAAKGEGGEEEEEEDVADAVDGLTVEEERLIASGRGGLGALLSSSSASSSSLLHPSASSASIHSLDGSSASASSSTAAAIAAATAAAESGEEQAGARRSSLGLIWGYLSRGKEEGGAADAGEAQGQQGQGASSGDVERVVAMVEKLEDELAHMTAKKEQAEAEAVIALAKQRRWSIEKERFERRMNEALARVEQLGEQIQTLEVEKEALRGEAAAKQQSVEEMEEAVKRAERERDVLRAEKHVWTVAHSGAQAELANLSAALEREKQAHEDTRAALKRAKEVAHKVKGEAEGLKARLDVKGDERALQAAQEELANARAEVRDLTEAVEETAAENDTLKGQVKLLARHVKQQKQEMAVHQTEAGHLRMRSSALENAVAQLKAEKKLLVKELRTALAQQQAAAAAVGAAASAAVPIARASPPPPPVQEQQHDDASRGSGEKEEQEASAPAVAPSTPSPPRKQQGEHEEAEAPLNEQRGAQQPIEKAAESEETTGAQASPSPVPPPPPPSEVTSSTAPATPVSSSPSMSSGPASASASAASSPKAAMAIAPGPNGVGQEESKKKGPATLPAPARAPAVAQAQAQQSQGAPVLDPRYQRLLNQLTSAQERRKQLLLLLEEDSSNEHVKQLASDLEGVLASLKRRMRLLIEAGGAGEGGGR